MYEKVINKRKNYQNNITLPTTIGIELKWICMCNNLSAYSYYVADNFLFLYIWNPHTLTINRILVLKTELSATCFTSLCTD